MIPEIIEMQTRALIEAALNNKYIKGLNPVFGIMIPLIGHHSEFTHQANLIRNTANKVFKERPGQTIDYKIGTMIEVPRAALTSKDIVKAGAEFFSFGTNDLTQVILQYAILS
jgi:pyruvate,orthophosphate dikinase